MSTTEASRFRRLLKRARNAKSKNLSELKAAARLAGWDVSPEPTDSANDSCQQIVLSVLHSWDGIMCWDILYIDISCTNHCMDVVLNPCIRAHSSHQNVTIMTKTLRMELVVATKMAFANLRIPARLPRAPDLPAMCHHWLHRGHQWDPGMRS